MIHCEANIPFHALIIVRLLTVWAPPILYVGIRQVITRNVSQNTEDLSHAILLLSLSQLHNYRMTYRPGDLFCFCITIFILVCVTVNEPP